MAHSGSYDQTIATTTLILDISLFPYNHGLERSTYRQSSEELVEGATANGYKHGAHQAEDSAKDNEKYMRKTLKD